MSFNTEVKRNGKTYVYESIGYWDKEKQQSRHKRIYVGIKDPDTGEITTPRKSRWGKILSFDYGVIHATNGIAADNQLIRLLNDEFEPEAAEKIYSLAVYAATQNAPFYLYENWAQSTWGMSKAVMSSQDVSSFLIRLGYDERSRAKFWRKWAKLHGKQRNFIFDITSISTYSSGLEFAEFGHNRDGEALPQVNIGLLFSEQLNMPLGYRVYPGSIGDIITVQNLLQYMKKELRITYARMVLDRGFHSLANLKALDNAGYDFIIPMPFRLKMAKELIAATQKSYEDASTYFRFNRRLMGHTVKRIEHAGRMRDAHVLLDFDRRNDELKNLHVKLEQVDERIAKRPEKAAFSTIDEAKNFIKKVAPGLVKLFLLQELNGTVYVSRDNSAIDQYAQKFGRIILIPSQSGVNRQEVLTDYFRRDMVEKFFDVLKNEMDFHRGRVRTQEAFDGRLFIHMLGLILYGEMQSRLSRSALGNKLSYPEMISHLNRLKRICGLDGRDSLAEVSKCQRDIFTALGVPLPSD